MSGLLRRLVLRVRDPATSHMPRIEPLLTPRYAAAGSRPAFDASTEKNEEPIIPDVSAVAPATPQSQSVLRPASKDRGTAPSIHASIGDRMGPALEEPEIERAKPSPHAPSLADAAMPHSVAVSPMPVRISASYIQPLNSAENARIEKAPSQAFLQALAHPTQALPTAIAETHRAVSDDEQRSRGPQTPAPATAPAVTIAIGHVEVGSAPLAAAPRPASFRPRVSLDDFLGRQRGNGR